MLPKTTLLSARTLAPAGGQTEFARKRTTIMGEERVA